MMRNEGALALPPLDQALLDQLVGRLAHGDAADFEVTAQRGLRGQQLAGPQRAAPDFCLEPASSALSR
jgi:hypothetical protein